MACLWLRLRSIQSTSLRILQRLLQLRYTTQRLHLHHKILRCAWSGSTTHPLIQLTKYHLSLLYLYPSCVITYLDQHTIN
jgi:hypothetical protein